MQPTRAPPACAAGSGHPWGATGRMPKPGQYTFESPQLARYTEGQHFLSHEVRRARWRGALAGRFGWPGAFVGQALCPAVCMHIHGRHTR